MKALYEHDKVKCLVNIAHGEGFGLPLFEAARAGLPIATIPWSGQLDFLQWDGENLFNAIDCTLNQLLQMQFGKALFNETLSGLMQIRMLTKRASNTSLRTTRIVLRALLSFKVRCWSTSMPKGFTSYSATL